MELIDFLSDDFFHKAHTGCFNSESYQAFLLEVLKKTTQHLACQKGFSRRRNTPLYRLKNPLEVVEKVMLLEANGVEIAVLDEVYRVRESTIRTWLARGGEHGRKLHDRFFRDLLLDHVQLDELWGNVNRSGPEVWVWVAAGVKTKIIPVMQVGERSQAAYSVAHDRCGCGGGQSSLDGEEAAQLSALVVGQGGETGTRSLTMLASRDSGLVRGGPTRFWTQNAPILARFSYPWPIVAVPQIAISI